MKNKYPRPTSVLCTIWLSLLLQAATVYPAAANASYPSFPPLAIDLNSLNEYVGNQLDSLRPPNHLPDPTTLSDEKNSPTGEGMAPASAMASCNATVVLGDDQYYCKPAPVVAPLIGFVSGEVLNFYWEPTTGLSAPTSTVTDATVHQTTTYTLYARSYDPDVNLIVNGDFEQGNRFFNSGYTFSPGDLTPLGVYDVLSNPQSANPTFPACMDHTSGLGNMLATSVLKDEQLIWSQDVPVTPLTDYYFSGWATRLTPIKVVLRVVLGSETFFVIPGVDCTWQKFAREINSGPNSTLKIFIYKLSAISPTAAAIDDLFLSPVCKVSDEITIHLNSVEAAASPATYTLPCTDQTITLHGTGSATGGLPVSYLWTTEDGNIVSGENTTDPVVNAAGTYTLTVQIDDPNYVDCTSTASVVVFDNLSPISAWITPAAQLNCVIKQTTLLSGTNQGGPLTYQWTASNGGNILGSSTIKNVQIDAPGTYAVVITDPNTGCTAESEIVVPNNTTPPVVMATASPLNCVSQQTVLSGAGSSTGTDFTYAWSTPNGKILSGADSIFARTDTVGTYILLVTNIVNLCTAKDTVQVTQNTGSPTPVILPVEQLSCLASNVVITVDSLAYTGPQLVYSWSTSPGGNIVSGADSLAPVVNAPGWYTLLVTDTLSGCTGTDSVLVTADTLAIVAIANAPDPLTCTDLEVQLNANGSTPDPTFTYLWTTTDGHIVSGADTPTPTVDAPGTYTLLLSSPGSGCMATDLALVVQNTAPPPVTVASPLPLTCQLTQQILQGQNANPAGAYTYAWSASNGGNILSGETTLTPVVDAAGTYTLLTTNVSTGCTKVIAVQLDSDTQSPDASLSVSGNLNCNTTEVNLTNSSTTDPSLLSHSWTNPDGTMGVSGTDPNWTAQQPGTYVLVLTNTQNGCTASSTATVIQSTAITVEVATQNDASCFGVSDGALSINVAGGNGTYTYLWNTSENTPSIGGLAAGTYTVVVTDGENCTATLLLLVDQPEALLANATATGLTAPGGNDGTASAAPSGGTGPYGYAWSNNETGPQITNLEAGFYTVTVTDAQGCTAEQTVEVWDGNCNLTTTVTSTDPDCNGQPTGTATALPAGGIGPFSYAWSSGATTQTAENLAAGTYEVVVTDDNDCAFTATVTLVDPPVLTLMPVDVQNTNCPNSAEGSATVEANGGSGLLSIEWSNGQMGAQATGLIAGTYTATTTDENGCMASVEVLIEGVDTEAPVITANPTILPVGPAGSVTLTTQNLGLIVTDNCLVDEVVFVPESFNCLQLGEQLVTATASDASGNTSSISFTVTVVDQEAPKVVCPANIRRCFGDDIVEYTAPVATDNCLMLGGFFDLIQGLPSGVQFPLGTTTTTYTFTDASGNVGDCSFDVTILTPLEITQDSIINDVGGQNMGGVQVTVSGSEPGYSYAWQQNNQTIATTEDLSGVGAGTYTLLVTDARGCTRIAGPFEVSNLVSTNIINWSDLIAVYPNPTSGNVYVVFPDILSNSAVHVLIFDATGRKVQDQQEKGQKQLILDFSAFADGLYTVLLQTDQGQAVHRVVLHR